MIEGDIARRADRLAAERHPFVLATVVRAQRPTSVRPGDAAVVLSNGTIDGFVGGVCAEASVRLYGLKAIESGEPVLLRLVPGESDAGSQRSEQDEGVIVERNPCLSGGSMEIFLEPRLPAPRLVVVGDSPIAHSLERLSTAMGYNTVRGEAEHELGDETDAVVVASHGRGEEEALTGALSSNVPYVGLVASRKRGVAVRDMLDLPDEVRSRLHTPAGLDIRAQTADEIAVSILAQIIAERHQRFETQGSEAGSEAQDQTGTAHAAAAVATAVDPICGMEVAIVASAISLDAPDGAVYFCSEHCRARYAEQLANQA